MHFELARCVSPMLGVGLLVALPSMVIAGAQPSPAGATSPTPEQRARLVEAYGQTPLAFEANTGQVDSQVAFLSRSAGYSLFLTPQEAVLSLTPNRPNDGKPGMRPHGRSGDRSGRSQTRAAREGGSTRPAVLRLRYRGANPSPRVSGLEPQAGRSNYLIGKDPSRRRTNVPQFAKVRCEEVYPGIDLVYYGRPRQLEFDFVVSPKADPRRIDLEFRGADRLEIDRHGDLVVHVGQSVVRQHKPVAYQERGGERQPVKADYVVRGRRRASFRVGSYDRSRPLVLDPVLAYAAELGGSSDEEAYSIALDISGSAYITGHTSSVDFPTANPTQNVYGGGPDDVFVAKLNPAGTAVVYSTYLGGSGSDWGYGVAVDGLGNAYVTGETSSSDFPTASPLQSTLSGTSDAFVAKLNPAGTALVYSTYLGGNSGDRGCGIAVDSAGGGVHHGRHLLDRFPDREPHPGGDSQQLPWRRLRGEAEPGRECCRLLDIPRRDP